MNKTLNSIQKFSKFGSIISKISLWCNTIGLVTCLILLIFQLIVGSGKIVGDSLIVLEMYKDKFNLQIGEIYAGLTSAIIICCADVVLAKKAVKYFDSELQLGTPFDITLADELKDLGKNIIIIKLSAVILANIAYAIFKHFYPITRDLNIDNDLSIGLGISFILISLLCRYQVEEKQNL